MIPYWDIQQGTPAWYKLRSGIPTASEFDSIVTPVKGDLSSARHKYACRLVAERVLRWQADSLDKIDHIQAGKENEPFAVAQFEEIQGIQTRKLGFATTDDGLVGATPDRVVMSGDRIEITLEVKSPTIPVQLEYLLFGQGAAYRCQVQGQLYVCENDRAIFYAYCPRTPAFMVETGRDEPFIKKLAVALDQFTEELDEMEARARSLGFFQPFPELVTPVTAAYADVAAAGEPTDPAAFLEDAARRAQFAA
jgi:hypothetical protein